MRFAIQQQAVASPDRAQNNLRSCKTFSIQSPQNVF